MTIRQLRKLKQVSKTSITKKTSKTSETYKTSMIIKTQKIQGEPINESLFVWYSILDSIRSHRRFSRHSNQHENYYKRSWFYFVNKLKQFFLKQKKCFNKKTTEKKRPIHSKCVSSKMSIIAISSKFYDKKEFLNSIEICITIASYKQKVVSYQIKTNSCQLQFTN